MEYIRALIARSLEDKYGYRYLSHAGNVMEMAEGMNRVAVYIAVDDMYGEEEVNRYMAEASNLRERYNRVILAVHESALPFIDPSLLERTGLGLLVVSNGNVELKYPGKASPIAVAVQAPNVEEIVERKVLSVLERERARMFEEVKRLVSELVSETLRGWPGETSEQREAPNPGQAETPESVEGVPQFIKENQWVKVLRSRKR